MLNKSVEFQLVGGNLISNDSINLKTNRLRLVLRW